MRTILVLVRKDIATFLRNRAAVGLTFFIPIALIYIFGWVFGLNKVSGGGSEGFPLLVANDSPDPAAQKLIDALQAEKSFRVFTSYKTPDNVEHPITEAHARQRIASGRSRFALIIPADLLSEKRLGVHLKLLSDPRNEIETQMVNGLLQKTIFSSVPQLLGRSLQTQAKNAIGAERADQFNRNLAGAIASAFGVDADDVLRSLESGDFGLSELDQLTPAASGTGATTSGAEGFLKRIVNLETEQVVGQNVKNPNATRVVGGWAIMFLLFAVSGSSAAFFDEKNAGLFQRLLAAPVRRSHLLWSRFLFGVLLGTTQLTIMFIAGRLMYGIDVFGHFGNLIVVCIAASAACTSFGMLIAAVSPNAQAASGLATFIVMVMSATGGAWYPLSLMPAFMQTVGKFTVVYWSMEGFSQVLWAGKPLAELLPILGVLLGITVGVMAIAVWRINKKQIFG